MDSGIDDARELLDLAVEEEDEDTLHDVQAELDGLQEKLSTLEFRRMFSGEMDENACFLDIQAGSGGTEAQDWANMMLRMYLRWGEQNGFKVELMEVSAGDVAGIKSATIKFDGINMARCVKLGRIFATPACQRLLHQYSSTGNILHIS